ncbi:DUF4836 family protein [Olleya sp. R77988]|uniref:DUF4836 family protein n=1 Tax=Olleya sp. R77988 TaxID=3093875 RepID=UPI0037C788B9
MRKILSLLTIALLFASCGSKNQESNYVPKDAIGVMYVNLKSLSEKSNGLDFKDLNINDIIEDKAPKELKDFMNEFMTSENINKTFRKEFLIGYGSLKRMSGVGGLILPIKDAASFEAFIKPMLDEIPRLEKETNVGKGDAFTVYANREIAIGWNNTTALLIGASNYAAAELKDLTTLEKSENINATDYYSSFFDSSKDIGVHITTTPLGDMLDGLMSAFSGSSVDLENNTMSYYGNFEDDHIHTNSKLKLNKDILSLVGYDKWMSTSYEKSLLKVLPNNPELFTKLSVDLNAFQKHFYSLQDNKVLPIAIREEMKNSLKKSDREFEKETGLSTTEFTDIFDGSVMFAMTEGTTVKDTVRNPMSRLFEESEEQIDNYKIVETKKPYMYGAIAIKDKAKFNVFLNKIKAQEGDLKELDKDYYSIDDEAFMIITDQLIFITNDVSQANQVKNNGQLTDNLSDFKHKDKLSHSFYLYTNGNLSEFTNSFNTLYSPYRYSRYNTNNDDEFTKRSNDIYQKYFDENHYYIDADGSESFTNTKGDKNSLIQSIKFADEMSKVAAEQ